ncbi:MAG: response regulator [Rhodospirillaceae bacterium]|nr:response regulator [Rhodospirillaceae bacterium]
MSGSLSTSTVWLLAARDRSGPAPGADPAHEGEAVAPAPRIQIVEDEALLAWSLEASLEDLGYAICGIAGTGAGAIRMAQESRPDLILMDVRLADDISGLAAAERILAGLRVPIIFIAAARARAAAERAARLGAELLPKPVDPSYLDAVIRRLLARTREQ